MLREGREVGDGLAVQLRFGNAGAGAILPCPAAKRRRALECARECGGLGGMSTGRLEAFSDGVIAILITIMILELKVPHEATLEALRPVLPVFLTYVLSYVFLGIYWNNHHHMMHATKRVTGGVLWANLHLLFWLSLIPFVTAWMGENGFRPVPTAIYGVVLLLASIAYYVLVRVIVAEEGASSELAAAVGSDTKGRTSTLLYALAIPLSFVQCWLALGIYILVALMWLVPDRRIESRLRAR